MTTIIENHTCVCGRCRLKARDTKFVAQGKKTEFVLLNSSNKLVDKYIVDDCLLKATLQEEKCDYLFVIKESRIAYLIECKGSDILKAVDQLNSTLNILKNDLIKYTIKAKIIPTKVFAPNLVTTSYKKQRERLKGKLEIKNTVCTETI